jgi:hypothetical protein
MEHEMETLRNRLVDSKNTEDNLRNQLNIATGDVESIRNRLSE